MSGIYSFSDIYKRLRTLRSKIKVAVKFPEQVKQVDEILENDKTGFVSTIYDFMVHASTVPMKIETKNKSLDDFLRVWQKQLLNKNVGIDVPIGLRSLSVENYKERWRSSLLALKVLWGEESFGNNGTWIVPKRMYFLNGGSIETENKDGALNTRKFFLKTSKKKKEELKKSKDISIFIRKPFTLLSKNKVVPYFIQRGTVFNALMKIAIVEKQSDVIEAVIPLILELTAGSENLTLQGKSPTETQFKDLKQKLTDTLDKYNDSKDPTDLIAMFRNDVDLKYLMPDLTKVFDDKIVKSTDKNLLASLGMIELQGFSSTRQEAVLNPKVLIEEVYDAVMDWADLLHNIMIEMLERNKGKHNSLTNAEVRIIPGKIKAFITDEMRAMLRSLYDRGLLSRQSGIEDIADTDFEVEIERHIKEANRKLDKIMKPPVIQNLEQYLDPELDNTNLEDQNKKPGTPEADNFNKAILENYMKYRNKKSASSKLGIINTPEGLPEEIKKLSTAEQFCYFMTYNCAIEYDNKTIEEAHKLAKESIQVTKKVQGVITAEQEVVMAPYENIDDLPSNVKNPLPVAAQLIWLRVFNSILNKTGDEDQARKGAWSKVGEKYKKSGDNKKWVKKASLQDYKEKMSVATFKSFEMFYNTALEQSTSIENAIEASLAIIEKISTLNDKGILVKNKTITKAQLNSLDNANVVDEILNLQLKEKKLELINKILKEE